MRNPSPQPRRRSAGPDDASERSAAQAGARRIVGVDEVGRGPLAGPVVAAAVWLDPAAIPEGLRDSKQLSAARRRALAARLHDAADVGIGQADVEEIDRINILQASHLAMRRAIEALRHPPDHLLIDGTALPPGLPAPALSITRGDELVLSIAAASIVAKVARDAIMAELAARHPGYGWETNMGYPTPFHRAALRRLGVTAQHRRSFRPVHKMLFDRQA